MLIERFPDVEILSPGDCVDVWFRPSPLLRERHRMRLAAGMSLAEMLAAAKGSFGFSQWKLFRIEIDGHPIDPRYWHGVRAKPGTVVTIVALPGKGAFRSILGIIVAVTALVLAPIIAGPIIGALGLTGAAASAVTGVVGLGITLAGSLAVAALFPTAPVAGLSTTGKSEDTSPLFSIGGGRNTAQQYGAVPVIFGQHRIAPPYASGAFTEISGNDQYLSMLFCVGYGPMTVTDLKIGETDLADYDDVDYEIISDHTATSPTLYTRPVYEETVSTLLDYDSGWVTRTTAPDVDWISLDVSFPQGVYRYRTSSDGDLRQWTVTIEAQYRLVGGAWQDFPDIVVTAASRQAVRKSLQRSVANGQYEIRVRKPDEDYAGEDTVVEDAYWTAVRARRNAAVVNHEEPVTLIALRIKATNELNGTIDQLNLMAIPKIRSWNGSSWVANQATSNPADHFRYVLQGAPNARPVADSAIDLSSLQDWHDFCAAQGFTFNYVCEAQLSVFERLQMIAAAGRARVSQRDGKWGVVWDEAGTDIVQHFSPRNSWDFSSKRGFAELPHGFRVAFINADNGYLNDERVVYDDGYSASNATRFDGLEFPGVTDPDLIWKHARYHLAQLRLQRETYTLSVDWENLVCTMGDRVRVNHDVVLWGAGSGRVTATTSSPDTVTVDDSFTMESGKNYSMRFRLADGSSLVRTITGVDGTFSTFTLTGSGSLPSAGDLAMFGENSLESVVLRVRSISAQRDLTAKLELVDDAPSILQADQGTIPAFTSGITQPLSYLGYAPTDLSYIETADTTTPPTSEIVVSWQAPDVDGIERYIVRYAPKGTDEFAPALTVFSPTAALIGLEPGSYDVWVRGVSYTGQLTGWLKSVVVADIFSTRPADVTGFRISVSGDVALLEWTEPDDATVTHYEIRYSSETSGVTWQTATVLRAKARGGQTSVPSARGTYLIKAVGGAGLTSANASAIVSTIDPLTLFNVVETVTEAAPFSGTHDDTYFDGTYLRLDVTSDFFSPSDFFEPEDFFLSDGGYHADGRYQFADTVDLSQVYTSKVSATISAGAEWSSDDFFALADFFERDDFFGGIDNQWDVTVEVSTTEDDPAGSPTWTDWAELVAGDLQARAFRFRAVLESTQLDVTPIVTSISVSIDMPDRVVAGDDLTVPVSGLTVSFSPPFKSLQGVAIAGQGLSTGDYADITSKDEDGFDIVFRNSAGSPVERTFDYVAKGYGAVQ